MITLDEILTNNRERNYTQVFEQYGEDVVRNELLPGHYYSVEVMYDNFNESRIPSSLEEWKANPSFYLTTEKHLDFNPTGLVFNHDDWKNSVLMLNLKVIPPKYKAKLIMAHLNLIESDLKRIDAFSKRNKVSINERKKINLSIFKITPSILEQQTGIKIGYAMNRYKIDKINNVRVLDWNNIGELPMANIETNGFKYASGAFNISTVFNTFEAKQQNLI